MTDKQLTAEYLQTRTWTFSHLNKPPFTVHFKFLPDGRLGGYVSSNEAFWRIDEGILVLLNRNKNPTVRFSEVSSEERFMLKGCRILRPDVILCLNENFGRQRRNITRSLLDAEVCSRGWKIGDHTYGLPTFIEKKRGKLEIGKYCSIAVGVKISFGNHRMDTVSTYPFRTLGAYWENVPLDVDDHSGNGELQIGSDVWIGTDAFILSGIKIGHGAVIGAKCVVTKDVPPYAIVAGNPARLVRYRFDEETRAALLATEWWNLDDQEVDALLPLMMSNDIQRFLDAVNNIKGR